MADFKVYHMDQMELNRFNADLNSPKFQAEYTKYRDVWTGQNIRQGGLPRETLLMLAVAHQKPRPELETEAPPAEPSKNSKPVKKELQTA